MRRNICSAPLFVPQRPDPCIRLELFRYPHTAEFVPFVLDTIYLCPLVAFDSMITDEFAYTIDV